MQNFRKLDQKYLAFAPSCVAISPGRINIIGEHVDYNGGFSLPAAINRYTRVYLKKRNDKKIVVKSQGFERSFELSLEELTKPLSFSASWHRYVGGSLQIFHQTRPMICGLDISIISDVPLGKGVSSSAALCLGVLNALNFFEGNPFTEMQLCFLAQQVEHHYLNLSSGLLDQFAVQFSKEGELNLVDFTNLSLRPVPLARDFSKKASWVLADPGAKRSLASSAYQKRVEETRRALGFVQKKYPEVKNFRDLKIEHLKEDCVEFRRLRFYVEENKRCLLATQFLKEGKLESLGQLLNQTHSGMDCDYEVSLPILNELQAIGSKLSSCYGGRIMGGGFGGCILFLVKRTEEKAFVSNLKNSFRAELDCLPLQLSAGVNCHAL